MIIFLLTACIAMSISFLCSLLEACLLSLSLTDIATISEKNPMIAKIWEQFKKNIQKPIAVILIVNTFSHTIGAALSGSQVSHIFGPKWIGLYSIIFSLVMIQWTEILPKTLGVKYNKLLAYLIAIPLQLLIKICTPFVFLIQLANRPFEGKKKVSNEVDAVSDISVLAHFAAINKIISQEQKHIVESGLTLSQKQVIDIMVTLDEAKCLFTSMSLGEALVEAHIHHHTRFPLKDTDKQNEIIGYVNFKDIVSALQLNPSNPSLRGICRPIMCVKNSLPLSELLNSLIKSFQHIALVKNAQGTVEGIVTLEDVVECIVGSISDEYDVLPSFLYQIADNRYVVGAGISLSDLKKSFTAGIPDSDISLNDWIIEQLNRVPRAEDKLCCKDVVFSVRKVRRSKIYEVIIDTGVRPASA